jgi:hypothetical protein
MTVSEINTVCSEVYGVGLLAMDPLAALWVAERILQERGVSVYKTISNYRNKFGKGTMFPAYGSDQFNALKTR